MNNGACFEPLREFIVTNSPIEHLAILAGNELFEDADTAAQLIVIRAGAGSDLFHLRRVCQESGFRRIIFRPLQKELKPSFGADRLCTSWGSKPLQETWSGTSIATG